MSETKRDRVTIRDIAERAGVSKVAVSYALNGQPGVSAATRERIVSIAEELGWYPNRAARALSGARTDACGLVLARPARTLALEPFFMIIYELEADYSNYLTSLGAPTKLVRKYAYRNALLPQITGLALALGAVVAGAIVVEIVFSYPGLGTLTLDAIENRDYFLIQGIFLFLITGVLIANFIIDIAYVFIDPRTRIGMQGGA